MNVHSGEKPYKCTKGTTRFSHTANMYTNQKVWKQDKKVDKPKPRPKSRPSKPEANLKNRKKEESMPVSF